MSRALALSTATRRLAPGSRARRPQGEGARARAGLLGPLLALALLAATGPSGAADAKLQLPARKSGLWEIRTDVPDVPPTPPARMCIDEKFDDLGRQLTEGAVSCSKQEILREGDRFVAESVCRIGESTATTRTVFTGSFDAGYVAEVRSTYAPPLFGRAEGSAKVDARWMGPCPPGQRPGDMTLPNGTTINLYDVRDAPRR